VAVGSVEADHNTTATGRAEAVEKLQGAAPAGLPQREWKRRRLTGTWVRPRAQTKRRGKSQGAGWAEESGRRPLAMGEGKSSVSSRGRAGRLLVMHGAQGALK
jgi:hypothetical protein